MAIDSNTLLVRELKKRAKATAAAVQAVSPMTIPGNLYAVNGSVSVAGKDHWVNVKLRGSGIVVKARNLVMQAVEGWPVNVVQTANEPFPHIEPRYEGGDPAFVEVPEHTHEIFNPLISAPSYVNQAQFLPLLTSAMDGLTVRVWQGGVHLSGGYATVTTTDIDLTSHVPSTGTQARWVLLSIHSDGTITLTDGTAQTARANLFSGSFLAYVPTCPTGEPPICLITLYHGMTAVVQNNSYSDIYDVRFTWLAQTGSGGSGDVVGPGSASNGNLVVFDGTTGKLVKDGGAPSGGGDVHGSASVTVGHMAVFVTDGYHIQDGGAIAVKAIGSEINTGTDDAKFATALAIANSRLVFGPSSAPTDSHVVQFDGVTGKLIKDGGVMPVKATGAEINTGTDDAKFATAYAVSQSRIVFGPSSAPTDGHLAVFDGVTGKLVKDGGAVPAGGVVATGAEINTGTDNTKFASPYAIAQSRIVKGPASSVDNRVAFFSGTTGILLKDSGLTLSGSNTGDQTLPVKATGAEINTGTDDAKFATPYAIAQSRIVKGPASAVDSRVAMFNGTTGILLKDSGLTLSGSNTGDQTLPVKATGAEIITGTDDAKFATPLAIANSRIVMGPSSAPIDNHLAVFDGTSGKLVKDGGAIPAGGTVATGAEINTGTDNAKFASPLAIANSRLVFGPSSAPTDGHLVLFDGVTGKLVKDGGAPGAGGGHVIQDHGTGMTARANLNFLGAGVSVADDSGNNATKVTIDMQNYFYIDQTGGTSDTYGVLAGNVDGSNKLYTVSAGHYTTGTLQVYVNGQLLTQGSGEDWVETAPGSGTFTLDVAPVSGDQVTAMYGYHSLTGIITEAPIDGTQYSRKDAGWVSVTSGASMIEIEVFL